MKKKKDAPLEPQATGEPPHSEELQALLDAALSASPRDGWPSRRIAIIRAVEEGYSISGAARLVRIDRSTIYHHMNDDPSLKAELHAAYFTGGGDWGEDQLRKQVRAGSIAANVVFLRLRGRQVDPVRIERGLLPARAGQTLALEAPDQARVLSLEELDALAAPSEAQEKAQDGS